jgi:hypothetical protein
MWNRNPSAKYGNTRASHRGVMYHSQLERDDAMWLESLEKEGTISNVERQVRYRIFVNGEHITDALVDFKFVHKGLTVWYETKGFPTDVWKLKRKLIEATMPEKETYIVNAQSLMEHIRGRTRKEKV